MRLPGDNENRCGHLEGGCFFDQVTHGRLLKAMLVYLMGHMLASVQLSVLRSVFEWIAQAQAKSRS